MRRNYFLAETGAALGAFALGSRRILAAPAVSFSQSANDFSFGNSAIGARWTTDGGKFRCVGLEDRINHRAISPPRELFSIAFPDGSHFNASEFTIVSGPTLEHLAATPSASSFVERVSGQQVVIELLHPSKKIKATWRSILRDGSHYMRQEVTFAALDAPLPVASLQLVEYYNLPNAIAIGLTDGAPVVSGNLFLGVEHPFSQSEAIYDRALMWLPYQVPLQPGIPLAVSSVLGTTHPGQLRREFLSYVERERAHPYRTFLHYNSWYDLGYFTKYTADQAVERIHTFGENLSRKRGVKLSSFLFDDGWDNPTGPLWSFNSGFPDGFAPLKEAAAEYGAAPGAWFSPWGGYGAPQQERVASAKREGYETDQYGLALSGPKYFDLATKTITNFIEQGGVNQFKIDGTGDNSTRYPGSPFGSNFDAAIHLIGTARKLEPNIYINLTTGTYPSPWWLRYCDSIWRGGEDHTFAGVGTQRQMWMTYRDGDTYARVVNQGQLYPLNSVMLHGIIYAQHAKHLSDDPHGDFRDEVHAYFSSGTQCQEMYCTPTLLTEQNWDDLAEAANWSRANADVLKDTHWVGGDPLRLEPYGWASWSPRKGILALRNPNSREQEIVVDIEEAFELPQHASRSYSARSAWRSKPSAAIRLDAGKPHVFTLRPFEVVTLDVTPDPFP
jgi:hypothetical protein